MIIALPPEVFEASENIVFLHPDGREGPNLDALGPAIFVKRDGDGELLWVDFHGVRLVGPEARESCQWWKRDIHSMRVFKYSAVYDPRYGGLLDSGWSKVVEHLSLPAPERKRPRRDSHASLHTRAALVAAPSTPVSAPEVARALGLRDGDVRVAGQTLPLRKLGRKQVAPFSVWLAALGVLDPVPVPVHDYPTKEAPNGHDDDPRPPLLQRGHRDGDEEPRGGQARPLVLASPTGREPGPDLERPGDAGRSAPRRDARRRRGHHLKPLGGPGEDGR